MKKPPRETAVERYFFYQKYKNKDGTPSSYGIEAGVWEQVSFFVLIVIKCFVSYIDFSVYNIHEQHDP